MSPPAQIACEDGDLQDEYVAPTSATLPAAGQVNHMRSDSVDGEGTSLDDAAPERPLRKRERMEEAVRTLLECLGEDPEREGLRDTPKRVAKSLLDCTCGYRQTAAEVVGDAIFTEESCGDIVIVRDIPVHSLCEHHMLPFTGKAHVAYIPDGKVIGLSKIGRIVDMLSRRLQVQERLTQQVRSSGPALCPRGRRRRGARADPPIPAPPARRARAPAPPPQIAKAVEEQLAPKGVAVVVECTHMCMSMRGVRQPGALTTTRALLGELRDDPQIRNDFMQLLGRA